MRNPSTNTDALRTLLERLFPNVRLSGTGVALLAAQIAKLEDRCEVIYKRIDHQTISNPGATSIGTRFLLPQHIGSEGKYGTNNHAK